jgi:hypothetical protein
MASNGTVVGGTDGQTERPDSASPDRVASRLRIELARLDPSLASIAADPASAHWLGRLLAEVERLVDAPEVAERQHPSPRDRLGC